MIFLTPQGKTFNQDMAKEFALEEDLVFLCGHYEGIDERVLEEIVTDYVPLVIMYLPEENFRLWS